MSPRAKQDPQAGNNSELVEISVDTEGRVSGLLQKTSHAQAGYVMAHGAGAGMRHPFLEQVAQGLTQHSIKTLRYQFLYMEKGSGRPDSPKLAHAAVRSAVAKASELMPGVVLFAGGKSFGGRMTSQAQAASPLPGVSGLIFFGFPLHPPGKPSDDRAKHLFDVKVPMLFLQGTRDEFAQLNLLQNLIKQLGPMATLKLFADADHSFHVPARTGRKDAEVRVEMLDFMANWIHKIISTAPAAKKS